MAVRRRAVPATSPAAAPADSSPAAAVAADPPIAPPKFSPHLKVFLPFTLFYLYLLLSHFEIESSLRRSILVSFGLSALGFFVTLRLIPVAAKSCARVGLFGYDINKKGTPQGSVKVPESLGIAVGAVFFVLAVTFLFFNFTSDSNWLLEYMAALASIAFMILLGFVDDVLDVPWRVSISVFFALDWKLILPSFAALPLLMAYAGHTTILIPKPLVPYIGVDIWDLGWIYKLYMGLLAVFCTNSINIHAGLNGLEVGQTVVIACAILIHDVMQIGASGDPEYKQAHAFSIYLVQPMYPSSVFVGDTYTYFAGMTLAVVGILGHFSETLLVFFAPQVLNFLLSLPQLAGFVKCPRYRLPRFDPETGLLTGTNDGTLVNVFLRLFGRKTEKSLCFWLLVFQAAACCFCFFLRWVLAGWYK